jgi:predicted dinucleotide-binding enzyme
MKIGIIGAGNIGANAARLFAEAGHEVAISNSRGPETLGDLASGIGVRATTIEEAARFGEVVMGAIPFRRYTDLPAGALSGKVFITALNYSLRSDGEMDLSGRTQSELVADHLSDSRVIKAFNTIYFERLAQNGRPDAPIEERETIFVAGDDEDAVSVVCGLIEDIGFAPVVTGTLAESTRQEPGSEVYNVAMTPDEARSKLASLE